MYNSDPNSSTLAALVSQVDIKDAFFMDLEEAIGPLVRKSLFLYVAYERKGAEAAKYKEDPKADVPTLKREAELRGITVKAMAEMVETKGQAFNKAISDIELLRVEFNLRYAEVKEYQERLYLRDEFMPRIREIMSALD